jgi:cell division transport system permease protein
MMRALKYFFDEAVASLLRGYKTGVIAIATIAAAFFVLGGFLMATANMERTFTRWQEAAEFSVYLTDDATPQQRSAIERAVRDSGVVAGVAHVAKDEAMRRFRENFGPLADATSALPSNPLPASLEVRLRSGADAGEVEALARRASAMPGVADVRYDRRWIERLMQAVGILRGAGFTLAAILVLAAALTVASVVRLALVARREEIHIMQLVGAPIGYIKGPFVVEGLIQGGVGALIAVVLLWITFLVARARIDTWLAGAIDSASLVFLSPPSAAGLLAAGMVVGAIGGLIAARSTREIHA